MAPDFGVGVIGYRRYRPSGKISKAEKIRGEELDKRGYLEVIGNFPTDETVRRLEEIDKQHRPTQIILTCDLDSGRASIYIPTEDYKEGESARRKNVWREDGN